MGTIYYLVSFYFSSRILAVALKVVPIPLYMWSISGKASNYIIAWPLLVQMIGDPSKYWGFNGISFRRELLLKSRGLHGEYN